MRFRLCAALVVLAACGTSGGTTSPTETPLSHTYVDSLVHANCPSVMANCVLASMVLQAMDGGAVPSRLTVSTPSGQAQWVAIVIATYSNPRQSDGSVDTTDYVVGFRDSTFTYGFVLNVDHSRGSALGTAGVYASNSYVGSVGETVGQSDGVGDATLSHVGTPCAAAGTGADPIPIPMSDCHLATYNTSATIGLGAYFSTVSFTGQSLAGVIGGPQ